MPEILGLFPTPLMRVPGALPSTLLLNLVAAYRRRASQVNDRSKRLSHTEIMSPEATPLLRSVSDAVLPHVTDFGTHLFGEQLNWQLKEAWVNVLETGGSQAMHNHANSFVSGVIYLTVTNPSSGTVFIKSPAGHDFVFTNLHPGAEVGEFNAAKFAITDPEPGDLVLFPSYLLHEVPVNHGPQRISLAFNAIPDRLNAWGYSIRFSGPETPPRQP